MRYRVFFTYVNFVASLRAVGGPAWNGPASTRAQTLGGIAGFRRRSRSRLPVP